MRYETFGCEDADYVIVAYGSSARISRRVMEMAREAGYKVGLLRPITLFPFPGAAIGELAGRVKGFLSVEMSMGQMVEDVRLWAGKDVAVEHYGRCGGAVHSPAEVYEGLKTRLIAKFE